MTDIEKVSMLKSILGFDDDSEDATLLVYLLASEKEILAWRYSYSAKASSTTSVPVEYEMTQIFAVVAGYSQGGAENQLSHSENGISRTFKYEDMLAYIHSHVIPFVGVM